MKLMKHTLVAAAAATLSLASMSAMAQPGVGPRGLNPVFAELKLTDAQKDQIRQINESYRPAQRPDRAVMEKTWQAWQAERNDVLKSKTFNEAKARDLIQKQQQQRAEFELKNLHREHDVFQVLTPAQQNQLLKAQAQRMNRPVQRGTRPLRPAD